MAFELEKVDHSGALLWIPAESGSQGRFRCFWTQESVDVGLISGATDRVAFIIPDREGRDGN